VTLTPSAVEIAGVFNFRDLGGGVTASGRRVRSGVIFRSAALDEMTDEGLATLESLGVRTVVDVRSESEVEIDGRFPFERSSIRWVHVPSPMGPPRPGSKEPDSSRSEMADHEDPMSLVFTRIMTVGAPFVGRVIREVADPTNKSVVLHCTSGKDRTGVIAALIQLIIGRDLDTVVADFERTRDYTDRIKADLRIASRASMPGGYSTHSTWSAGPPAWIPGSTRSASMPRSASHCEPRCSSESVAA
jgi:protein-tyrosine phosphatase